MPLISRFSGPNMALLWQLARHAWPNSAWIAVGCMAIGYAHGAYPDDGDPLSESFTQGSAPFLWLIIVFMSTSPRNSTLLSMWHPSYCPLPASHRRLAWLDFLFYSLLPMIVCAFYLAGLWIAAPFAPPHMGATGVLLALYIYTVSLPVTEALKKAFGPLIALLPGVLLVGLVVWVGMLALFGLLAISTHELLLGVLAAGCVSYTSLRLLGPRATRPDNTRHDAHMTTVIMQSHEDQHPPNAPFSKRTAAQQWFILRRLEVMHGNPGNWVLLGCTAFTPLVLVEIFDSSKSLPADFMTFLGVIYLVSLYYVESMGTVTALPYSPWARTLGHCRLLLWGVSGISIFGLLCFVAEQLQEGDNSWAAALWLPWVAWASVVLVPAVVPGLLAVLVLGNTSPHTGAGVALINVIVVAVTVFMSSASGDMVSNRAVRRHLGAFTLVGLGLCTLHLIGPPPARLWIAREVLCSALVLILLHYNTTTNLVPAHIARRIAVAFGACVAVSAAMLALLGAPVTPGGVTGVFLGLGVVTPLFLPLVWMPHAIGWAKAADKRPPVPSNDFERALWEDLR